MSEKFNLINKLKKRQEELNTLESLFAPKYMMGRSSPSKYEISHTIIQMIGVLAVFLLIGLFIGKNLKKRKRSD